MGDLELIRVSDDQVVIKRGVREFLLRGAAACAVAERLLGDLRRRVCEEEILKEYPADFREIAGSLLRALEKRGLIAADGTLGAPVMAERPEDAFFWNFGRDANEVAAVLEAATVRIVGDRRVGWSLARSLAEVGIGTPVLHARGSAADDPADQSYLKGFAEKIAVTPSAPSPAELAACDVICATSDTGRISRMLEVSRAALRSGRPFLPTWVSDLVGYVGPLTYPFETACLRCYELRLDSNDERRDVSRSIRHHDSDDSVGAGALPPMLAIVGEIAAMEIVKLLTGFSPVDAVARSIEINLVSFSCTVRRVLKLPRCPDCAGITRRAPTALTHRPQVPYSGE